MLAQLVTSQGQVPLRLLPQMASDDAVFAKCLAAAGSKAVLEALTFTPVTVGPRSSSQVFVEAHTNPMECSQWDRLLCGNRRCKLWIYEEISPGRFRHLWQSGYAEDRIQSLTTRTNGYLDLQVEYIGGGRYASDLEIWKYDGHRYVGPKQQPQETARPESPVRLRAWQSRPLTLGHWIAIVVWTPINLGAVAALARHLKAMLTAPATASARTERLVKAGSFLQRSTATRAFRGLRFAAIPVFGVCAVTVIAAHWHRLDLVALCGFLLLAPCFLAFALASAVSNSLQSTARGRRPDMSAPIRSTFLTLGLWITAVYASICGKGLGTFRNLLTATVMASLGTIAAALWELHKGGSISEPRSLPMRVVSVVGYYGFLRDLMLLTYAMAGMFEFDGTASLLGWPPWQQAVFGEALVSRLLNADPLLSLAYCMVVPVAVLFIVMSAAIGPDRTGLRRDAAHLLIACVLLVTWCGIAIARFVFGIGVAA